jgi:hypothetical protein
VLSAGVGGRADLLVFDDVCDQRTSVLQPAMREQIKRVVYETWLNLLGPEGRAVYIATVWHPADLTVELRDGGHWTTWWQGARDELTGELLWPERWSEEALRRREGEIGSRAFARQFLLQAVSDEERLFSPEAIRRARDSRYHVGRQSATPLHRCYVGVDLAASLGKKASYTVIFVVGLTESQQRLPLEIVRTRMSLSDAVTEIRRISDRWKPAKIVVENNSFQEAVLELVRRERPRLPLVGHHTGAQKADEQIGVPSVAASLDRGEWIIPSGGVAHGGGCDCAYCAWQREMALYPACEHSDTIMAMWFAELAAREGARGYIPQSSLANMLKTLDDLRQPSPWRLGAEFDWSEIYDEHGRERE